MCDTVRCEITIGGVAGAETSKFRHSVSRRDFALLKPGHLAGFHFYAAPETGEAVVDEIVRMLNELAKLTTRTQPSEGC